MLPGCAGSRFAVTLSLALVMLVSFPAYAERTRVAVATITGDDDGEITDLIVELLDEEFDVIGPKRTDREAEEIEAQDFTDRDMRRLVRALGVGALVVGSVERGARKIRLQLRTRVRGSSKIGELTASFRDAAAEATRRKLSAGLRTALASAESGVSSSSRDKDTDDRRDRARDKDTGDDRKDRARDKDIDDEPKDRKDHKDRKDRDKDIDDEPKDRARDKDIDDEPKDTDDEPKDTDDEPKDTDDEPKDTDDEPKDIDAKRKDGKTSNDDRSVPRSRRNAAFVLSVGTSAARRSLRFTARDDFPEAPPGQRSPIFATAAIRGEAYPLALRDSPSLLSGLGIAARFDRVVSLTTGTSAAPDVALTTVAQQWAVGARFRYNIGQRDTLPTVAAGFAIGQRKFVIDRAPLPDGVFLDLPDVTYQTLEPSVGLLVPVGARLALLLDASLLIIRSAGAISAMSEYGESQTFGIDGGAGLRVNLSRVFAVDVQGQFVQIGHTFKGGAQQTDLRDKAPGQDVGGAADRTYAGAALLTLLY